MEKARLTVTIDKEVLRKIKLLAVNKELTLSKITEDAFILMLNENK